MATKIHQHKCSMCGLLWEHQEDSFDCFKAHICQSCGFLEMMVFKPSAPPFGPADYPRAVANLLKAINDPDHVVRVAAINSLAKLAAQPHRVVPALAWRLMGDPHRAVRDAAVNGLQCFGLETCRTALGSAWESVAPAFNARAQGGT